MVKHLKIFVLIAVMSFVIPFNSLAQPGPGCDPLDPACPIDGGLSLLIAAAVGIAAKKGYDAKRKPPVNNSGSL
ncbi:MAG: hypothetical protein WKF35_11975 [Ferruginibacter sp.]